MRRSEDLNEKRGFRIRAMKPMTEVAGENPSRVSETEGEGRAWSVCEKGGLFGGFTGPIAIPGTQDK